jgi:hypothetical protein
MSLIPSESLNFPDDFRATIKPGSPKEKTSLLPRAQPKPLSQNRFTDQPLILLIRILIVSAAAAVVIFPMIFFRRWENSRARER